MRVQGTILAAGFRVPYALLTGDLSQSNFASSRVGLNEFRRMIDMMQWQIVIPMFCQPVWDWFIEAANLAGLIELDRVPVEWAPPSFESVNPLQDANADLVDVRAGFRTIPQMIAKRGYDPDKVIAEQAAFLAKSDALGLVFDADPRMVSKGGQAQAPPPGDDETND
jgi:capsid protein